MPIPPPALSGGFGSGTADDWTDDPSFDLTNDLSFSSSSTSSSSRSSRPALSLSVPPPTVMSAASRHRVTGSPLRQMHKKPSALALENIIQIGDDDDDDFDFDLPDDQDDFSLKTATSVRTPQPPPIQRTLPPPLPPRSSTPKAPASSRTTSGGSASSMRTIPMTVVGQGPAGVGTITRLGRKPTPTNLTGTVKARAKAIEKSWEADVDFESVPAPVLVNKARSLAQPSSSRKIALSPPTKTLMPDASVLDDLGFDLGSDDEDQATLRASATIKAMLPPPRRPADRTGSGTIKGPPPKTPMPARPEDDDLETDLLLPLNLTNLTLATQSAPPRSAPRTSLASTATDKTDWDTPSTASTSGRRSNPGGFSWGDDSPVSRRGRASETSVTSISSGNDKSKEHGPPADEDELEEDYEDGLVLPDPSFFSARRTNVLNSILDRKRRPEYAPQPPAHERHRSATSARNQGDDSFEDGLVLDNPRAELSQRRLDKKRLARTTIPVPFQLGAARKQKLSTGPTPGLDRTDRAPPPPAPRDDARERERDNRPALGRQSPGAHRGRYTSGERRTLSGGTQAKDSATTARRPESPHALQRERSRERPPSRHRHTSGNMPAPPVPPIPPSHDNKRSAAVNTDPAPTPARTLRHQKSHHHLAPSPSPTLARKQSLASLQDAIAAGHVRPGAGSSSHHNVPLPPLPAGLGHARNNLDHADDVFERDGKTEHREHRERDTPQLRQAYSTSRLTMPTSSSLAKIRAPVHNIFPRAGEGSGPSSSLKRPGQPVPRVMELPRRHRHWGDGTELEGIEDLRVEPDPRTLGYSRLSRKSQEKLPRDVSSAAKADSRLEAEKRKTNRSSATKRPRQRRPAMLIKNLGGVDKQRVVGEMTWNPQKLRWEGNEAILRDFDAAASSTRPALISHFTGSSVGTALGSPMSSNPAATVRIIGDMKFDPEKMCWVSLLPPGEDEPDPFEGMADDEDDVGATITRSSARKLVSIGLSSHASNPALSRFVSDSTVATQSTTTSTATAGTTATGWSSASWEDRTRPQLGTEIPPELWHECREAEERHRREMRGWTMRPAQSSSDVRDRERREEKRLWEVRNLAMKLG
ncbi:hypothetical protein Q8F55_006147 [Vanrija albida]|uniref:Protein byr4 n=1 Tax=Vanrija albida TaxID=181172 RepID=A0ABR3PX88_9TREE